MNISYHRPFHSALTLIIKYNFKILEFEYEETNLKDFVLKGKKNVETVYSIVDFLV